MVLTCLYFFQKMNSQFFSFLLFTSKNQIRSFIFLGESTACKSAYNFIWLCLVVELKSKLFAVLQASKVYLMLVKWLIAEMKMLWNRTPNSSDWGVWIRCSVKCGRWSGLIALNLGELWIQKRIRNSQLAVVQPRPVQLPHFTENLIKAPQSKPFGALFCTSKTFKFNSNIW